MRALFVKKGRERGETSFFSFDLFFNQIKFLITFGWDEIMPLKSFQMERGSDFTELCRHFGQHSVLPPEGAANMGLCSGVIKGTPPFYLSPKGN